MLYYDRIDLSERIDVAKVNKNIKNRVHNHSDDLIKSKKET